MRATAASRATSDWTRTDRSRRSSASRPHTETSRASAARKAARSRSNAARATSRSRWEALEFPRWSVWTRRYSRSAASKAARAASRSSTGAASAPGSSRRPYPRTTSGSSIAARGATWRPMRSRVAASSRIVTPSGPRCTSAAAGASPPAPCVASPPWSAPGLPSTSQTDRAPATAPNPIPKSVGLKASPVLAATRVRARAPVRSRAAPARLPRGRRALAASAPVRRGVSARRG